MKEIVVVKEKDMFKSISDKDLVDKFNTFLIEECKLTKKKAFSIIYYLQESLPVFPDHIEKCTSCGSLYDTWSEGDYIESKERFLCGGCM